VNLVLVFVGEIDHMISTAQALEHAEVCRHSQLRPGSCRERVSSEDSEHPKTDCYRFLPFR
jgi:hypothetical protein